MPRERAEAGRLVGTILVIQERYGGGLSQTDDSGATKWSNSEKILR